MRCLSEVVINAVSCTSADSSSSCSFYSEAYKAEMKMKLALD